MKNTIVALRRVIEEEAENQSQFAIKAGVERTTLANDIGDKRRIPDERFQLYLRAVTDQGRITLIRARLLDLIPEEYHSEFIHSSSKVQEAADLPSFPIQLREEIKSALRWLSEEVAADPTLEKLLLTLCERLGWDPTKVVY